MFYNAAWHLSNVKAKVKYISFEPLLERIEALDDIYPKKLGLSWLIIGRLTGFGHQYDPKVAWVEEIVRAADKAGAKVFLKDNLKPLLGDTLRQEMPE